MKMDISTWIAIITVLLGVFGALVKVLWDMTQRRLEVMEKSMDKLVSKEEVEALKKSLDTMEQDIHKLHERNDDDNDDMHKIVENLRESLADARETIAGFGASYVTRKEFYEDRKN